MPLQLQSPKFLFQTWRFLAPLPGGKFIFSKLLGLVVPYSGTLKAQIVSLGDGICEVHLKERWRLKNHLNSIHAMALANVCELSSGLALLSRLASDKRGILVGFNVRYHKKARGTIVVKCNTQGLKFPNEGELVIGAEARDLNSNLLVTVEAHWLIGSNKT